MKPSKTVESAASVGVPQGESSGRCSVQILSKFSTESEWVTAGLKDEGTRRSSSACQLMDWGKGMGRCLGVRGGGEMVGLLSESCVCPFALSTHAQTAPRARAPNTHLEKWVGAYRSAAGRPAPQALLGVAREEALEETEGGGGQELGPLDLAARDLVGGRGGGWGGGRV